MFAADAQAAAKAASPQGGRAAKSANRGATGPPDTANDHMITQKLVLRTCSILLQEQRNLDSKVSTVLLLPADNGLTRALTNV